MDDKLYFAEAAKEAQKALCLRAKCGAVIVKGTDIIGRGYNAPPLDNVGERKCLEEYPADLQKPKSDRTCCMHAEWRAILDALRTGHDLAGTSLYFVRVDADGNILPSNEPYCTVCSRLALDTGIVYFYLQHENDIGKYDTAMYNDLSYTFHTK